MLHKIDESNLMKATFIDMKTGERVLRCFLLKYGINSAVLVQRTIVLSVFCCIDFCYAKIIFHDRALSFWLTSTTSLSDMFRHFQSTSCLWWTSFSNVISSKWHTFQSEVTLAAISFTNARRFLRRGPSWSVICSRRTACSPSCCACVPVRSASARSKLNWKLKKPILN